MKKIVKLSLVAAVAVAGLTTTSSAADLSESIKNTTVTGYVRYRYTNGESQAENTNNYKILGVVQSKVSENVTAKVVGLANGDVTDSAGDANPAAVVREANFIIKAGGATIIAGKQGLVTPFADAGDQKGTGVVALYPVGGVTLAAGWYSSTAAVSAYDSAVVATASIHADGNESNMTTANVLAATDALTIHGNNIAALAVIGAAGPVNYSLWYANINEDTVLTTLRTANGNTGASPSTNTTVDAQAGAKALNLNLAGKFGPVNVELNMAKVSYSLNQDAKDAGLAEVTAKQNRLVVSGSVEGINLALGRVTTGSENGEVTLGDSDAQSNFNLEAVSAKNYADGAYTYAAVGTSFGKLGVNLEYVVGKGYANEVTEGTAGTNSVSYVGNFKTKAEETKLSVSYAMAKNFTVSAFMTDAWTQLDDTTSTKQDLSINRIEMIYTF